MKLYILVDKELSHAQRAVQGGHAIAEFLRKYPKSEWNYGSLVFLSMKDRYELSDYLLELVYEENADVAFFEEPFWDHQLTAVAVLGTPQIQEKLKHLQLL